MVRPSPASVAFSRHLGTPRALALALGVLHALVANSLGGEVLVRMGEETPVAYLLAGLLFLPLLLSLLELAASSPGSSGLYQLARNTGSVRRAFAVGWLLLGGAVAAMALLTHATAVRLELVLTRFLGLRAESFLVLALVLLLVAGHELAGSGGRFRGRAVVIWIALAVIAVLIVASWGRTPSGAGTLPELLPSSHWLGAVALLGGGLWGFAALLGVRDQLRRPRRTLLRVSLGAWGLSFLCAAVGSGSLLLHPDLLPIRAVLPFSPGELNWDENRLELLLLTTGLLLTGVALSILFAIALLLVRRLAGDGFLPLWLGRGKTPAAAAPGAVLLLGVAAGVGAPFASPSTLGGLASLPLLAAAFLLLFPHARRRSKERPPSSPRLPLHPLLPVLALAVSAFFILLLPALVLELGVVWVLAGVATFIGYSRAHASRLEETPYAIDLEARPEVEHPFTVLVATGGEGQVDSLLRLGAALARARGGELIALRVFPLLEQRTLEEMGIAAQEDWEALDARVDRLVPDLPTRTLIRIAPTPAVGILEAAAEHAADFLLLGWPRQQEREGEDGVVEEVFPATSRPLGVLHGNLPATIREVVVATAGGPHAPLGLELGQALAAEGERIARLRLATVVGRGRSEGEAEAVLGERTLERAEGIGEVETVVLEGGDVAATLARAVGEEEAVLIIGASVDRLLGQTVFGALAGEIADAHPGPTLLVKRSEDRARFWLRRAWELLSHPLPALSVTERSTLFAGMRHAARADIDFFMLIFLSALIATAGLVLDSAAVIIGAMLVAPLMSPILAAGHGLVVGNLYMLRRAAASTLKGIGVAVAVGTLIALALPPRPVTGEMLARGEPNLLDLLVAVAAGAAAAYAVSRKNLSAALPGVAISVALVPPLCVVGLGLGSSNFPLAAGALLLFATNLTAIILIGGFVFLLLGVRPGRGDREIRTRRALVVVVVAIALISVPLWLSTRSSFRAGRVTRVLEERLSGVSGERIRVADFTLEPLGGGFRITATVFAFEEIRAEDVEAVRQDLAKAVGAPVTLRLTLVPARRLEASGGGGPGAEAAGNGRFTPP